MREGSECPVTGGLQGVGRNRNWLGPPNRVLDGGLAGSQVAAGVPDFVTSGGTQWNHSPRCIYFLTNQIQETIDFCITD